MHTLAPLPARKLVGLLLMAWLAGLAGCARPSAQTRLEGKWVSGQDTQAPAELPQLPFGPALVFQFEFKSDHSMRARLPVVGEVFGTWRTQLERRNSLQLTLSYSNDGRSRYVENMHVTLLDDNQFTAQPPGAPGPVRFSRVK